MLEKKQLFKLLKNNYISFTLLTDKYNTVRRFLSQGKNLNNIVHIHIYLYNIYIIYILYTYYEFI